MRHIIYRGVAVFRQTLRRPYTLRTVLSDGSLTVFSISHRLVGSHSHGFLNISPPRRFTFSTRPTLSVSLSLLTQRPGSYPRHYGTGRFQREESPDGRMRHANRPSADPHDAVEQTENSQRTDPVDRPVRPVRVPAPVRPGQRPFGVPIIVLGRPYRRHVRT